MPNEEKPVTQRQRNKSPRATLSSFVRSVLHLYTHLPHTPERHSRDDLFVARRLEQQRVPLLRLQAALLLGAARRADLGKTPDSFPLLPIRSIRYFLPILEELRFARVDAHYVDYLHRKLCAFFGKEIPLIHTADQPSDPRARKPRTPRQLRLPW